VNSAIRRRTLISVPDQDRVTFELQLMAQCRPRRTRSHRGRLRVFARGADERQGATSGAQAQSLPASAKREPLNHLCVSAAMAHPRSLRRSATDVESSAAANRSGLLGQAARDRTRPSLHPIHAISLMRHAGNAGGGSSLSQIASKQMHGSMIPPPPRDVGYPPQSMGQDRYRFARNGGAWHAPLERRSSLLAQTRSGSRVRFSG
jgi:hypothetical protein